MRHIVICGLSGSTIFLHIIARAERDGTRAETRFRLSPKRTGPFKSVGASVQSTAGSRGVLISLSNVGYTTFGGGVRVLATHSIRQFSLQSPTPLRHRVPPGSERALPHKRHDFREKVTEHKMRVFIISTTLIRTTSHSRNNRARYDDKCILVFM